MQDDLRRGHGQGRHFAAIIVDAEIERIGGATLDTHRELKAPLHDRFPFDFFADVLYPGQIVDDYEWTFELAPRQDLTREQLLEQADALRTQVD